MSTLDARGDPKTAHGTGLCWAARIIALCAAGCLALGVILPVVESILHGDAAEDYYSVWSLLWFMPLVAAVISWRWHSFGGSLMIIAAIGVGANMALNASPSGPEYLVVQIPIALVFLSVGILHLMVWWKESSSRKIG
ncbi:MAG: hypothetical protein QUS33_11985 [Dehalococcoidia bacterium]|nr:hypothetical protein [Dehalococcoidia bacterium]